MFVGQSRNQRNKLFLWTSVNLAKNIRKVQQLHNYKKKNNLNSIQNFQLFLNYVSLTFLMKTFVGLKIKALHNKLVLKFLIKIESEQLFWKIKIWLWGNIFVSFRIFRILTLPKIWLFYNFFCEFNRIFWPPKMPKWTFLSFSTLKIFNYYVII